MSVPNRDVRYHSAKRWPVSHTIEAMASTKEVEKVICSPRFSSATSGPGRDERRRKSTANLKAWPKGVSGNPAGKNGWSERNDLAAKIARAIFEQDGEAIFELFGRCCAKVRLMRTKF